MELLLDICSLWAWGTVERREYIDKSGQTSLSLSYAVSQTIPSKLLFIFGRKLCSIPFSELTFVLLSEGTFSEGAEILIFHLALSLDTGEP